MRKLAILDLDHLLFKSEEFWQSIVQTLSKVYADQGVTASGFEAERLDRSPTGPGRVAGGEGYDLFVHLSTIYGIDRDSATKALVAELKNGDWLYSGAVELIRVLQNRGYHVVIMTVGAGDFQALKLKASGLPRVPFRSVLENKGVVLAREWDSAGQFVFEGATYDSVLVIDDCAATFDAVGDRPGLDCVQVTGRPKYPQASSHSWVSKTTELDQIVPLIDALPAQHEN